MSVHRRPEGHQSGQDDASWSEELARRRQRGAHTPRPETPRLPDDVEAGLCALFDDAAAEANAAFAQIGAPDRIESACAGTECRYFTTDADGTTRSITLYLSQPVGSGSAGACIGTSETRQSLYLLPVNDDAQVAWTLAATGAPFTADLVHDLFLSVFADDPEATTRISPLSGTDLFQTPWG
jgi:hypothetical protein